MKKTIVAVVVVLSSWYVNAARVAAFDSIYTAENGYVPMIKSDSHNTTSYTTSRGWPQGHGEPQSGYKYYVGSAFTLTVTTNNSKHTSVPFAGDELVVAGQLYDYGVSGYKTALGTTRMLAGSEYSMSSIGSVTEGTMTVEGTRDNPVLISYSREERQWKDFLVEFKSKSDGFVRFHTPDTPTNRGGGNYNILTALPEFYGTIVIDRSQWILGKTDGRFEMPGGFEVLSEGVLKPLATEGSSDLGFLKLCSGGVLYLSGDLNAHYINIADKLVLDEDSIVMTDKFRTWASGTPPRYLLFRLSPEAVQAGLPDFDKVTVKPEDLAGRLYNYTIPGLRLVTDPLGNGGMDVSVSYYEWVKLTNNTAYASTPFLSKGSPEWKESCDPSHFWSDGLPPSPEKDYFVSSSFGVVFRDTKFDGHSLVCDNVWFGIYSDKQKIPLVVTNGGRTRLQRAPMFNYVLQGMLCILKGGKKLFDHMICVGNRSKLTIESVIKGDGDLLVWLNPEHQDDAKYYDPVNWTSTVELNGENSAYTGRIAVYAGAKGDFKKYFEDKGKLQYAPSSVSNVTLVVSKQENLGGPVPEFTFDSLSVSNECRLVLKETSVYDEPTRGWAFPERGYIQVPDGKHVTVAKTITYGSELVKEGAGTLTLAAVPRFYSEGISSSTPNGAKLKVLSGALRVGAPDAVKGLALEFAAKTKLIVPMLPDGSDSEAAGLDLTASALNVEDGRLRVELDVSGCPNPPEKAKTVHLFTVPAGSDILDKVYVARPYKGYVVKIKTVQSGEGVLRVDAVVERLGMTIVVK
jgi:hypothetical protein